ncbi:MAG: hypothetical protein D6788_04530, partial [Planctomycetota bacterium]
MLASVAAERNILIKLLNEGTLSKGGLAALRRESELSGLPLVDVLVAHDLISEADVARAFADLAGLRFV